jgi:hypothetical protein
MKKSSIQKTKLTKAELKEVNGGALLICPAGLCIPKEEPLTMLSVVPLERWVLLLIKSYWKYQSN